MYIIFTDLDGTLLDHNTYSCDAAHPALDLLQERGVPLIFCTSKTRAELEHCRREMNLSDPFISENGGAIFIPKGYFDVSFEYNKETDDYFVIELGTSYSILRQVLKEVEKEAGCKTVGFGDMTPEEVDIDCKVGLECAKLAKMREYDEAFKIIDENECLGSLLEGIEKHGLNYTRGGRYFHIMGDNDKGKAVSFLTDIFRRQYGSVTSIGLGDSLNDLPMLQAVDIPVLVQKPDGTYESEITISVRHADGAGPVGWNKSVLEILG
jgi:mannosyl-3-phosphoglycerate phosphatase